MKPRRVRLPKGWEIYPLYVRYVTRGDRGLGCSVQRAKPNEELYSATAVETSTHARTMAEVFGGHAHKIMTEGAELTEAFRLADAFVAEWTAGALDCACDDIAAAPAMNAPAKRTCSQCGCTDDDCRQCIEATGEPCFWVTDDMCSACADPAIVAKALDAKKPAQTNGAPDPLSFTQGVLELVVEEAKRREAVVRGVLEQLEPFAPAIGARKQFEGILEQLRTAMDPGLQAPAEPTLDETLTSKVTPQERLLVARLLEQADAAIATMRTHQAMRARIAELEHECMRHVRDHVAQAARVEELEQDVRTFVAAESATWDIVKANVRAMRRFAASADLPKRPRIAWRLAAWAGELEDAVAVAPSGLYSDATEAFITEWRVKRERPRAPRAASSGGRAASPFVQDAERFVAKHLLGMQLAPANVVQPLADAFANTFASGVLAAREADAGQAKSAGKPAGSAEHGTADAAADLVPAARQKARAAGKKAEEASFEARCRRREANRQRGPPSARDVAHVEQKKATKKKQTKRAAVRRRSPGKRGSP